MLLHSQRRTVGEQKIRQMAEDLGETENVIPAAVVESDRVLAQLVEDLVHLECGGNRLDQYRHPDRSAWQSEDFLGRKKHVVPEPRLQVTLELRQIEVRARASLRERRMIVGNE